MSHRTVVEPATIEVVGEERRLVATHFVYRCLECHRSSVHPVPTEAQAHADGHRHEETYA